MKNISKTKFGLLGLAYDTSASLGLPGARYAPGKIRNSLQWILNRIKDNKIYDTEAHRIVDMADIEMKDFGDVLISRYNHQQSLAEIKAGIEQLLAGGYSPILLGGDHSVTLPGFQALHDHAGGNIGIIQLDSHLDLVEDSFVQGKYSGSSEIRRAIEMEKIKGDNVVQIGIRGYNYAEHFQYINENNITVIPPGQIFEKGIDAIAAKALEVAGRGTQHIYLTVDIDVLDSAFAPGSGANEPGGITSYQLFSFVKKVAPYVDMIDIVEVNPLTDYNDMTSTVAARLVFDYIVANYYAACQA
ncbi:agmatinase family protein [Sporomusa sp.]|uniref:agmatinase family protein n=1 Tax=Sporomusa sp. TaxID=2078658 RepID=UPI002C793D34|nr:agmatinase family protein [Sporomusa sp.]HWR05868.1 agmatinase family protein [Sporomusa sp.]